MVLRAWCISITSPLNEDERITLMETIQEKRITHTLYQTAAVIAISVVWIACYPLQQSATSQPVVTISPISSPMSIPLSPSSAVNELSQQNAVFLDELARDTWTYLSSDWATDNHLPWSWRSDSPTLTGGDFANPTEIGLYALSWIGAYEMRRPWSPDWSRVEAEVISVLDQLRVWQTGSQDFQPTGPTAYNQSVFYQWYWISWNPPVVGGDTVDHVVPSVDNAWLAASLITIREYGEANNYFVIAQKADDILSDMNFDFWYHPDTHRFSWGASENPQGGTLADYYSNENRIINFVARALGQLNKDEYRLSLKALEQPTGIYGSITVEKTAWDGSYFTYASPALFIREMETSYGINTILPATQAQIAYAQAQGYGAWGLSDCYGVEGENYVQQGAPPVAMSSTPETNPGLVTPHASALALITPLSSQVITNLQTISSTFSCAYDPLYGFRDSVMANQSTPSYGQCSNRFTALAQEWIFLAIVNKEKGIVWEYFYRDLGVMKAHNEMFGIRQLYMPLVMPGGNIKR
jgi:hypothetical protein